jgi:hypothetical protein
MKLQLLLVNFGSCVPRTWNVIVGSIEISMLGIKRFAMLRI